MTVVTDVTSPQEYVTNTDEVDALALDVTPELSGTESVVSAVCELIRMDTGADVALLGFAGHAATVASNVVTQQFDATGLSPGPHRWIWNVTLNTAAIRSYRTLLRVTSHD